MLCLYKISTVPIMLLIMPKRKSAISTRLKRSPPSYPSTQKKSEPLFLYLAMNNRFSQDYMRKMHHVKNEDARTRIYNMTIWISGIYDTTFNLVVLHNSRNNSRENATRQKRQEQRLNKQAVRYTERLTDWI